MILDRRLANACLRGMATELGLAASTISRELPRSLSREASYWSYTTQRMTRVQFPLRVHEVGVPALRGLVQEILDMQLG